MIELLTGVPGSGKTYFAVDLLSKVYAKKERPIFTNINLVIPFDEVLQPLDIKDFHDFCTKEMEFFANFKLQQSEKRKNNEDLEETDNYDEALKASGLLSKYGNSLILWDECHNDLDNADDAYVRWMSYHRHFEGMDVLLITQNLSLIARKYKGFIDKYYFGLQASKRFLSSTFKYKVYTDHRQYEKYLIETISLSSNKKVFALYDSGHYKVNKSVFLKKILPIFAIVFFGVVFYKYFFFGLLFHHDKPIDQNISIPATTDQDRVLLTPEQSALSDSVKQDQQNNEQYFIDQSNNPNGMLPPPPMVQNGQQIQSPQSFQNQESQFSRYIIKFNCTQTYCYFLENRLTIPLGSVKGFFEQFNGKILFSESITPDFSTMTALVPSELYYLIESHKISIGVDSYDKNSKQSPQFQNSFNGSSSTFAPSPFVPNKGV